MTQKAMATFRIDVTDRPKQLFVYPELCVGCHLCSYACSLNKYGVLSKTKTAIRIVRKEGGFEFPNFCIQCEDKTCMKFCPTDALVWNARVGSVDLLDERCISCGICAIKCEYDAISFENAEVVKCDLCSGDPQCVKFCPTDAIRFEDSSNEREVDRERGARERIPTVHEQLVLTKDQLKAERERAKAAGVVFAAPKEVAKLPSPADEAAASGKPYLGRGSVVETAGLREERSRAEALLPTLKGVDEVAPVAGLSDIESRVHRALERAGVREAARAMTTDDLLATGLKLTHTIVAFSLLEMERKGFVADAGGKRYFLVR
ncbi:MAG TPA: 4Fe-4S binding protein [Candidatus Thermoplasmatota archaeon]|nr:4Fe-4S binding protein [Candidatus Thermoplasmatota archaeon]